MNANTDRAGTVVQLRDLLRERFPEAHRRVPSSTASPPPPPESMASTEIAEAPQALPRHRPELPLGLALLDELDDGRGLPPGSCVEIVGRRPGGGSGALLSGLVQAAATGERRYPLALVDGADSFDPFSLGDTPATATDLCRHLLWVRCRHRIDHAFKVADLLLRDGNLPVVVLDLQFCRTVEVRRGIPGGPNAWYRLRSLAESTGTVFLAFTAEPLVPAAPWRLEIDHSWPIDAIDHLPATGDLRREPVRHRIIRSRQHGSGESEEEGKHLASLAAAS